MPPKNENILQKLIREAFEAQVKKALDSTPPFSPPPKSKKFSPPHLSLWQSPLETGRIGPQAPRRRDQADSFEDRSLQERARLSSEENRLGKEAEHTGEKVCRHLRAYSVRRPV